MRARAVAAIALSGALAFGLSGCNMYMHVETARYYDPSDGVGASIEGLELRNLLVVSEDGELGNLVGGAVNTSDTDFIFMVQWTAAGSKHQVVLTANANSTTLFGIDEQVLIDPVGEIPGGLLVATVHVATGQQELRIPVLDSTLAEYAALTPTPVPTPTPTATADADEADAAGADADAETPEG